MDVAKTRLLDGMLGTFGFPFLAPFKSRKLVKDPQRILLIQLWGIGETILTLPAIKAIRGIFPEAQIQLLCTPRNKEVYFQNPHLNQVLVIEAGAKDVLGFMKRNRNRYDLVIDFEEYLNIASLVAFRTGKSSVGFSTRGRKKMYTKAIPYNDKQHCAETFMDLARIFRKMPKIKALEPLAFSPRDEEAIENIIKIHKLTKKKIICIAPSVAESSKSRMWPLENYTLLAGKLAKEKNAMVVFIGGPDDKKTVVTTAEPLGNKVIDLSGKMNIRELFCFITRCDLVIGNDSGPMHISAAQGIKTIGLFGPNTPDRFGPFGKHGHAIIKQASCPYLPCLNVHKGEMPDCLYLKKSKHYQKCMKAISVDEVFKKAKYLL